MSEADLTLNNLTLEGETLKSNLTDAITSASFTRAIDSAPVVNLEISDPDKKFLQSGIFTSRSLIQIDKKSFELVRVGKSGTKLSLEFEDVALAALRRQTEPVKIAANTMNRVQFAKRLLQKTPWIPVAHNPSLNTRERTKVELYCGNVDQQSSNDTKPENYWECLKRIFNEVGWRCYIDYDWLGNSSVNIGPDTEYLGNGSNAVIIEENTNEVDYIDFTYDAGEPVAEVSFVVRSGRWSFPPGTPVQIVNHGVASGLWLCTQVSKSFFTNNAQVTLKKKDPEIPEPDPPPEPDTTSIGETPSKSSGSAGSANATPPTSGGSSGWLMPVKGTITSNFGPRKGRLHAGLDIGAATGTPIFAAKSGVVTYAGWMGGYGNCVDINHGNGWTSRYAHMSKILVSRGVNVQDRGKIGLVGSTGNSTGPHLHFEIRKNNTPQNPRNFV